MQSDEPALPLSEAVEVMQLLQAEASEQRLLLMWTIYNHPSDYPEDIVARCFVIGGGNPEPLPTAHFIRAPTTKALRTVMRLAGLTPIARMVGDNENVVETWL